MNVGYCTNLPSACAKAASHEAIPLSGPDSRCPECNSTLLAGAAERRPDGLRRLIFGAVALILLAAIGFVLFSLLGAGPGDAPPAAPARPAVAAAPAPAPAPAPAVPPVEARTILSLSGSNTIGKSLAPNLVEGWLKASGASDIHRSETAGMPGTRIVARLDGAPVAVNIRALGSRDAFLHLADGSADVGMASRRVDPEEVRSLAALGPMTAAESEHVIALDGIAVIVAPENPLKSISRQDLARVFTGEISDWSQLGGPRRAIRVHALDDRSGTYETFSQRVLGTRRLLDGARRYADNAELEREVASDAGAIGFVGLPFVRSTRVLAVADGADAQALVPTVFTVRKEDYALARRLYLYTAARPANAAVPRFVDYVQSEAGQAVVKASGFVEQYIPTPREARADDGAQGRDCLLSSRWPGARTAYCELIAGRSDAGTNFRFQTGSAELDNRAVQDLQRLLRAISATPAQRLLLVGFADAQGPYTDNLRLAEKRADAVRAALAVLGIRNVTVRGFGAEIPVADNATPAGRESNRRVEVWYE